VVKWAVDGNVVEDMKDENNAVGKMKAKQQVDNHG
jgi:hypothetical protein